MKRTLVTGAAGFTGRYLVSLLASRGHEVHGLVQQAPDRPVNDLTMLHVGDLADGAVMRRLAAEVCPDYVIHLAAIAFVAHGDVEEMYRSNVLGTRQLLEALAVVEKKPRSVVIASSANIYGNSRSDVVDEGMPPAPANDYGVTKVAAEYVASIYRERLPITIVRPFNYTGVGQGPEYLIPKIVRHVRDRAPTIELGNLDVARDFSDVRDVVKTYARLLETSAASGETYNMASGQAISLHHLIDLTCELAGHRMTAITNPAFVRPNEVRKMCGSSAKLDEVLPNRPKIALRDTLQWMLETA